MPDAPPAAEKPAVTIITSDSPSPAPRRSHSKLLLIISAVVCYVGFWWIGGRLGISRLRGFDGSLLLGTGVVLRVVDPASNRTSGALLVKDIG